MVEWRLGCACEPCARVPAQPDDLHRHMDIARLLAVSHGEGELMLSRWEQAKALEELRQARLPPQHTPPTDIDPPPPSPAAVSTL